MSCSVEQRLTGHLRLVSRAERDRKLGRKSSGAETDSNSSCSRIMLSEAGAECEVLNWIGSI